MVVRMAAQTEYPLIHALLGRPAGMNAFVAVHLFAQEVGRRPADDLLGAVRFVTVETGKAIIVGYRLHIERGDHRSEDPAAVTACAAAGPVYAPAARSSAVGVAGRAPVNSRQIPAGRAGLERG